jgi:hypothetical protein
MFCCIVVFQFRQNLITEASIAAASKKCTAWWHPNLQVRNFARFWPRLKFVFCCVNIKPISLGDGIHGAVSIFRTLWCPPYRLQWFFSLFKILTIVHIGGALENKPNCSSISYCSACRRKINKYHYAGSIPHSTESRFPCIYNLSQSSSWPNRDYLAIKTERP